MKNEKTDVLIVGAGPAGISAALELKRLGVADIIIADREPEGGGIPRLCHHVGFGIQDMHRIYSGPAYARRYVKKAKESGITIRTSTTITGWQGDKTLAYSSPSGLGRIEAAAVLLATGCRERPRSARLIPGRRMQGVFTTGSLQRFVEEHHLPVGKRSLIVGAELVSLSALTTLTGIGVDVAMMVTSLPQHQIYFPFVPMKWMMVDLLRHAPIRTSTRVNKILGGRRVEAVEIIHTETGEVERVACDSIIFTGDWIPENEVARNGRLTINNNTNGPQIDGDFRTSKQGVFAAGNLLRGVETADTSALEGRAAARHIHEFLQTNSWPTDELSIEVESPISWVFPNRVAGGDKRPLTEHLSFRVSEFCQNVLIHICQGDNVLHAQTFRRLLPNQTMRMKGNWLAALDFNGEPLKITLVG